MLLPHMSHEEICIMQTCDVALQASRQHCVEYIAKEALHF